MKFNYAGRAQSEGRVQCKTCTKPMLGVGEQDPNSWCLQTMLAKTFCACPEPQPSTKSEARQWDLLPQRHYVTWKLRNFDVTNGPKPSSDDIIKVIEYSAFEQLKRELADLQASMQSWYVAREIEILANSDRQWNELIAQRDQLQARISELEGERAFKDASIKWNDHAQMVTDLMNAKAKLEKARAALEEISESELMAWSRARAQQALKEIE